MSDTFSDITDHVQKAVQSYIDARWPTGADLSSDRYKQSIEAGKALICLGISFVGNALGIADGKTAMTFAQDLLKRLGEKARALHDPRRN